LPRRGAHRADYIRTLQPSDIDWLTAIAGFPVLVTLAPECCEAGQIRQLGDAGIRVCAGHSDASYADIQCALNEGLCGFTHLFNAMTGLTSREPGVVGAALADRDSWCGIIVDGHHVHPATVAVAHAAKAPHKLFLVSDAMATVGSDSQSFELYGETVNEHNGRLINAEGRLAGSAISMIDAVRICVSEVGLELTEVLRMASLYPAQFIRQDHHRGALKPGFQADLVHFNLDYQVQRSWIAGCRQDHW
jgi:N-acetylglucosamine-6-phosphate deacetylase